MTITNTLFFLLLLQSSPIQSNEFLSEISIADIYARTLTGAITTGNQTFVASTGKSFNFDFFWFDHINQKVFEWKDGRIGQILPKVFQSGPGIGIFDPIKKRVFLLDETLNLIESLDVLNFRDVPDNLLFRQACAFKENSLLVTVWYPQSKVLALASLDVEIRALKPLFNTDPGEANKGNFWGFDGSTLLFVNPSTRAIERWHPVTFEKEKDLCRLRETVANPRFSARFSNDPWNLKYMPQVMNPIFTNTGVFAIEDLDFEESGGKLGIKGKRMIRVKDQKAEIEPLGLIRVGLAAGVGLYIDLDTGAFSFKPTGTD